MRRCSVLAAESGREPQTCERRRENRRRTARHISRRDGRPTDAQKGKKEKKKEDGSVSRKKPGLTLALEDITDAPHSLGRIIEDVVSVNTLHPAWRKALETKQEEYHILVVVGLVLAEFVAPEKHPLDFLAKFLSSWSAVGSEKSGNTKQASLL